MLILRRTSTFSDYHTASSSTSEVVGGTSATSAGVYAVSLDPETWTTTDRVIVDYIYHPAVEPVYGEPHTGCGYWFYSRRHSDGNGNVYISRSRYPRNSPSLVSEDDTWTIDCPSGYFESSVALNSYERHARGCSLYSADVCPVTGSHLSSSYEGRPYLTLITPGQDAWNEPVYGNVTTTHYRDTFGARSNDHFSQSSYCRNRIRHGIRD